MQKGSMGLSVDSKLSNWERKKIWMKAHWDLQQAKAAANLSHGTKARTINKYVHPSTACSVEFNAWNLKHIQFGWTGGRDLTSHQPFSCWRKWLAHNHTSNLPYSTGMESTWFFLFPLHFPDWTSADHQSQLQIMRIAWSLSWPVALTTMDGTRCIERWLRLWNGHVTSWSNHLNATWSINCTEEISLRRPLENPWVVVRR